jgi:hypothetical protein
LYINFGTTPERKLQTLEGIVSGGIGCGKNTPAWYTRVITRPFLNTCLEL